MTEIAALLGIGQAAAFLAPLTEKGGMMLHCTDVRLAVQCFL